jgi:hypothetical protein
VRSTAGPIFVSLALGVMWSCSGGGDSSPEPFTPFPDRGNFDGGDEAGQDPGDAGGTDGPAAACDRTKPFGAPVAVAELNTVDDDVLTDMSADELTAYVATNHGVAGVHLFYATRASTSAPFGALATLLPTGAFDDWNVAVSPDALTAVVASNRGGNADLYVATRPNTFSAFGALGTAAGLDTPQDELAPKWGGDAKTLYFDSTRSGNRDLYRSAVTAGVFGAPVAIAELNGPDLEAAPVLTPDELTIYFLSLRAPTTDGDIYVATRADKTAPFSAPKVVAEVNSPSVDAPAFASADGCRLYLSSARNGGVHYDIFVATRPL